MSRQLHAALAVLGWLALVQLQAVHSCNEALCASLVSKCMLLKSCECNMIEKRNCSCCKDCHRCLAKLYVECCDCVGMCPSRNTKDNSLTKTSSVEELDYPIPELFSALTEEDDTLQRWTTYTYPAHLDLLYFKPRGGQELNLDSDTNGRPDEAHQIRHGNHHLTLDPSSDSMNCTVSYMAQCMSLSKCKDSCQSMGATRFRWFHQHGCCECIGSACLDYGKGVALCHRCPLPEGEDEDDEDYYDEPDEERQYSEDDDEDEEEEEEEEDEGVLNDEEDEEVRDLEEDEKNTRVAGNALLDDVLRGEEQRQSVDDFLSGKV